MSKDSKHADLIIEALSKAGLQISFDNEELAIEPVVLKLQSLKVRTVRQGRYIADPRTVPDELKEKNVLWLDLPIEVTATTESGKEIPVYLSSEGTQVEVTHEEIHPDDEPYV